MIAIEEHWTSAAISDALDRLPEGARDESVAFNTMGDNQARLEDIGRSRIEAMDAAGIDLSILSVVTPATQALPAPEAVTLAREANDEATEAVRAHPDRFRAFRPCRPAIRRPRPRTRTVRHPAGPRRRDDPRTDGQSPAGRYRLRRPVRDCGPPAPADLHPSADPVERSSRGHVLGARADDRPRARRFGWGWHIDAALSALRLIVSGTFDFTTSDRVLFSTDYPVHRPDAGRGGAVLRGRPRPPGPLRDTASGNAEALSGSPVRRAGVASGLGRTPVAHGHRVVGCRCPRTPGNVPTSSSALMRAADKAAVSARRAACCAGQRRGGAGRWNCVPRRGPRNRWFGAGTTEAERRELSERRVVDIVRAEAAERPTAPAHADRAARLRKASCRPPPGCWTRRSPDRKRTGPTLPWAPFRPHP